MMNKMSCKNNGRRWLTSNETTSKIDTPAPVFVGLTWEGHEFLDAIREQRPWETVKNSLTEKGAALSYEALKGVVVATAKSLLVSPYKALRLITGSG